MKLLQLVNSKDALQRLVQKELPIKTAYRLSKFIKKADHELELYEEQRVKLINKYGTSQDDQVVVLAENTNKFLRELNEILEMDVDITFEPFSLEELGDIGLTTVDLMLIDYLIKD